MKLNTTIISGRLNIGKRFYPYDLLTKSGSTLKKRLNQDVEDQPTIDQSKEKSKSTNVNQCAMGLYSQTKTKATSTNVTQFKLVFKKTIAKFNQIHADPKVSMGYRACGETRSIMDMYANISTEIDFGRLFGLHS